MKKVVLSVAALLMLPLLLGGCSTWVVGEDTVTFTASNCKPRELNCVLTGKSGMSYQFTPPYTLVVERQELKKAGLLCDADGGARYQRNRLTTDLHIGALAIDMLLWGPFGLIGGGVGVWTDAPDVYDIPVNCAAGEVIQEGVARRTHKDGAGGER